MTPNKQEAARWYLKAAEQGVALAQNNVASLWEQGGTGIAINLSEAAYWYQKAASQGLPIAQWNIARLLWDGRGIARARVTAAAWALLADNAGHEAAHQGLDHIREVLRPSDLLAAESLAIQWKVGKAIPEVDITISSITSAESEAKKAMSSHSDRSAKKFPQRPPMKAGIVSCNTNCINDDCYRTYDDGRQVRIKATRRMNAFGDWEWDEGDC